jgi:YHS domain-containing protein
MDRIVSFLLFAGLFYFMMRLGCGAHAVHGHHHAGRAEATGRAKKDLVCDMYVEQGRGYSEVFSGREYRFCSRKCLDKFDAEPQRFASGRASV